VETNSTGGQGSRRAVAPSDDDNDDLCSVWLYHIFAHYLINDLNFGKKSHCL
jgi:hypothetical protein